MQTPWEMSTSRWYTSYWNAYLFLNIYSRTSAKSECNWSNLSYVFMYVDKKSEPPPSGNDISSRNLGSLDLGSPPKFTLEWYSFSNRSLKITLLQIYFNIRKLFEAIWKMEASFSKPLSQSEYRTNKMLQPSGEEGCSPIENTGFPDTTNTTCNRSNQNAGFPDTQPLSQWACGISRHNPSMTQCWQAFLVFKTSQSSKSNVNCK